MTEFTDIETANIILPSLCPENLTKMYSRKTNGNTLKVGNKNKTLLYIIQCVDGNLVVVFFNVVLIKSVLFTVIKKILQILYFRL